MRDCYLGLAAAADRQGDRAADRADWRAADHFWAAAAELYELADEADGWAPTALVVPAAVVPAG